MAYVGTVAIQSTNEAASMKRIIGSITLAGVDSAGSTENFNVDVGLSVCNFIKFTPQYVATNPINCALQNDAALPISGSAVTLEGSNNGVVYFEALGTGS